MGKEGLQGKPSQSRKLPLLSVCTVYSRPWTTPPLTVLLGGGEQPQEKAALPLLAPAANHFTSPTLPCFPLFLRMTHWGKTIGILTFLHKSYLDPSNGFWT